MNGYKGKGILIHLLVDADRMPMAACSAQANEDERKYVGPLLDMIAVKTGKPVQPPKNCGESQRTKDVIPIR